MASLSNKRRTIISTWLLSIITSTGQAAFISNAVNPLHSSITTFTSADVQLPMVGSVLDPVGLSPPDATRVSKVAFSPMEVWCMVKMEEWERYALGLKCPWIRRRMLDAVDTFDAIARTVVVQKKCLLGAPIGCRGDDVKQEGLAMEDLVNTIRRDWRPETLKGYYVTGSITSSIYRNDCVFDGPDPDMPVKGLRKFRGAASQLFDRSASNAELHSLEVQGDVIVARWRMNGVLRLPFRPKMPEVVGTTTYHLDENNLIYLHEESWDISPLEAFYKTDWFGRQQSYSSAPMTH